MNKSKLILIGVAFALHCLVTLNAQTGNLSELLTKTGERVQAFLNEYGDVKCIERVTQERVDANGHLDRSESSFDYLLIARFDHGELLLDESRLPLKFTSGKKQMAVSNGFSTALLIFHPRYRSSFEFRPLGTKVIAGAEYAQVRFRSVKGRVSPVTLFLGEKQYALELEGTALIDQNFRVRRIRMDVGSRLASLGIDKFRSEVEYVATAFPRHGVEYLLPSTAIVEVRTTQQYWRNRHHFTDYQFFSTSTSEVDAKVK